MINEIFQAPDLLNDSSKYQVSVWWNVLQANKNLPHTERVNLFERALKCLPYCYKLWLNYIKELQTYVHDANIISQKYQNLNEVFEKCLLFLHKMPKIWLMYTSFLQTQQKITLTRKTYDRALKALPVTQHEKIWSPYIEWTFSLSIPSTVKSIIHRYTKINPDVRERYVDYLIQNEEVDEVCFELQKIVDDQRFQSESGKSKYQFIMQLCKIISENPLKIKSIDCEAVIRHGIKKYSDETGNLWIYLSDYFIKQGNFEQARDVFEEALESVLTARDFGLIYNTYINFEEEMINLIQFDEKIEEENQENLELEESINKLLNLKSEEIVQEQQEDELGYRLRRLEKLLDRRAILLSNCILRQNKNNVAEWLNRLTLFQEDQQGLVRTFGEALVSISLQKAINGLYSTIWYIQNIQVGDGQVLFKTQGLQEYQLDLVSGYKSKQGLFKVHYKSIEDHLNIWTFWVEYLLEHKFYKDAFTVCKQALFKKSQKGQPELIYNLKIWSLYLDMELNLGTQQTIKQAFTKCIELKVASPFIFMTYANYLENLKFFEESFKIYEIALDTFSWPVLYEIWILYLSKFVSRYEGTRLERTRDLFESVLLTVQPKQSKVFYLMYAEYEEKYGLINHVIEILDRLCGQEEDKLQNYNFYIAKVSQFLGITKTRAIFEKAIQILENNDKIDMGQRFALLERKLGEIDRARAIYKHISQFTNPEDDQKQLWKTWEDFEIKHGNVDTYKDFMRAKRTIQQNYFMGAPDVEKIRQRIIEEQEVV